MSVKKKYIQLSLEDHSKSTEWLGGMQSSNLTLSYSHQEGKQIEINFT